MDVSDCSSELRFVERLYGEILQHHGAGEQLWNALSESGVGKFLRRVKKVGAWGAAIELSDGDSHWASMGEELAGALEQLNGRTLIQIDELPVFVLKLLNRVEENEQGRVREFLYWLRRLRQTYPSVRWMLAGSIGLDTVASRLNIADSVNDLKVETVGAFDSVTARSFLQTLARSYAMELGSAAEDRILERVGWAAPYYLQLVFNGLRDCTAPGISEVDEAVDDLLRPHSKGIFDYWRQRLRDELGPPDCDHAKALLNTACQRAEGASHGVLAHVLAAQFDDAAHAAERLRYLLDVLENDGYLVEDARVWRFRSPLLREYWARRVAPPEAE